MLEMVLLSLNTSRIVVSAASGPLTSVSTAACGRYVKKNMNVVTPTPVLMMAARCDVSGFQRLRCEM